MQKIKIIRLPSFFRKRQFSSKPNCCLIPPLGLGLIVAYLRSRGIALEQDDLNIKLHYDNCYLASTENRIDVEVFFDMKRIENYSKGYNDGYIESIMERIDAKVKLHNDQIILLSLPDNIENNSNLAFALAYAKFIKKRYNSINILGGQGPWSSLLMKKYNCKDIDFVIQGDGEYPLFHLLDFVINNKRLDNIKDLSMAEGCRHIIYSRPCEIIKPDFSGLPLERYRSRVEVLDYPEDIESIMKQFQERGVFILPYRFMRGCPFECIFCISSTQKLSHALPPEKVVQHLKSLQEEYNPTGFFFLNDTINISKEYINRFCDEIIANKLKILWSDCARIDNLDKDTLFKMRQAGCIRLIFGMETASSRLLKYINKKINLKNMENVLRWTDEVGIWTGVEVICGFPHEKQEDIDATIFFLNANKEYINRIYLNCFDLRQNSILYNSPQKYGLERIFKVDQCTEKDFSSYVEYGFDEMNGLQWKDKVRQIDSSMEMVRERCAKGHRFFTDEHLLFFLYSYFNNKYDIKSIYLKILGLG
ncbi:B12-binding domain-containing radical SAM protein [Candidatus Omnitrophota bacterium]